MNDPKATITCMLTDGSVGLSTTFCCGEKIKSILIYEEVDRSITKFVPEPNKYNEGEEENDKI